MFYVVCVITLGRDSIRPNKQPMQFLISLRMECANAPFVGRNDLDKVVHWESRKMHESVVLAYALASAHFDCKTVVVCLSIHRHHFSHCRSTAG